MKKQNVGNACGWADRLARLLLLPALTLVLLCSCDEDKAKSERPEEGDQLWKIVPVLASESDGFEGLGEYGVSLYLFNDMSSDCYKYQHADSFGDLEPFVVEKAAYSLVALMMDRDVPHVFYEASDEAKKNTTVTVTDMNETIPDMVLGTASVSRNVGATVPVSDLQRLVGALDVRLTDVPNDVTAVELTVGDLYDRVDLTGQYDFATGEPASKRIELTKEGTVFSARSVLMPSDETRANVKMDFRVFRGDAYEDFVVRLSGSIPADKLTRLEGRAEEILKNAELTLGLTYAPWDASITIEDHFQTDDDLNKVWSSAPLPISGAADPGYDNFWASSDGGDSGWGETFWQYNLYDGNKTDGSNYWCPAEWDRTAPIWYIDLGAAKQGVTIDYWNKAGGKGGQKIKTMDIYASNTRADYGGGNADWVKIMTFTSDKTTPTTDAGAQVTTGKIAFSEDGSVSYQYVKCVMTSKVNPDGATITDVLDVNVGEVEVSYWEFK